MGLLLVSHLGVQSFLIRKLTRIPLMETRTSQTDKIPSGKSSGRLNDDARVPALVVHSNSWSRTRSIFFGRPHFNVVKDVVEGILASGKDAWFLTSRKAKQPTPSP